jgi:hypothetical protein
VAGECFVVNVQPTQSPTLKRAHDWATITREADGVSEAGSVIGYDSVAVGVCVSGRVVIGLECDRVRVFTLELEGDRAAEELREIVCSGVGSGDAVDVISAVAVSDGGGD